MFILHVPMQTGLFFVNSTTEAKQRQPSDLDGETCKNEDTPNLVITINHD